MEFNEVLTKRHSVRKFTDEEIPEGLLDRIIEDAKLAPSSRNCKSSGFVKVTDPEVLEALSKERDYGSALISGAKAAIVVTGDSSKTDLWAENCSITATYILLSATSYGLGSCWVHVCGRPRFKSEPDKGQAEDYVRQVLGLEEGTRILCIVALGYEAV